jgi:hypothetical protein
VGSSSFAARPKATKQRNPQIHFALSAFVIRAFDSSSPMPCHLVILSLCSMSQVLTLEWIMYASSETKAE